MKPKRWLSEHEEQAWRSYRRMQTVLPAQLARDLTAESGLSEPDYDVLSTLSEMPGHRWRLRDLAARMLWSRSRLSHHVARMEERGLVTREDDPEDRRGCMILLTDDGMQTLTAAAVLHVASVRRHFIDLLSEDELSALGAIAERVVDRLGQPDQPGQPHREAR